MANRVPNPNGGATHKPRRFVRVASAYRRDQAKEAAGIAYTLAQDISALTDTQVAKLTFQDRSTFNRKRRGVMPSAKSAVRDEIIRIGEGGGNPWPLVADDFAAAVQVTIASIPTEDLKRLQRAVYHREQKANGAFDAVQFLRLDDQPIDAAKARKAKLEQAAWTLLLVAIHDELTVRRAA